MKPDEAIIKPARESSKLPVRLTSGAYAYDLFADLNADAFLKLNKFESITGERLSVEDLEHGRYHFSEYSQVLIPAHSSIVIPAGIEMALPEPFRVTLGGYTFTFKMAASIVPRSGLAANFGITVLNAPGTIDSDYRGEVGVILYNTTGYDFLVEHHSRIAQMSIATTFEPNITFGDLDTRLPKTARGDGGFGHTGVK